MRRSLTSQFHLLSRRSGVTPSVKHRKYKVQSPVPRVMNSSGSTSCPVRVRYAMRASGSSASTKMTALSRLVCLGLGLKAMIGSPQRLEVLLQIHAGVQRRHIVVAVEHQRLALAVQEAVLAYAALGSLRPARVNDVRIDVGIKAVFARRRQVPRGARLVLDEADFDDGFGRLEAVLPRQHH